ncbi:MAG TPA: glycosyltransferase [Aeromicrobium sp.]|nr:glycosyltransferase [Aeromicrobium sp.]
MTIALTTADHPEQATASRAIHGRLLAVHDAFGIESPETVRADLGALFEAVVLHVAAERATLGETWLLLIGLTGCFPEQLQVRTVRRQLDLLSTPDAMRWLLTHCQQSARERGSPLANLEIVTDRALVDVNVSAKWPHLTGVQRVVRETARLWQGRDHVELTVWNDRDGAYRRLNDQERLRIDGLSKAESPEVLELVEPDAREEDTILVPWGAPLVLLEVPFTEHAGMLAAVAEFAPSPVRVVGYDCIPASSADLTPDVEPEKFGMYLEIVKFADKVAAISRSSAEEFRGFGAALAAQGLQSPELTACPLPTETAISEYAPSTGPAPGERPVVLTVGSLGLRKNQTTLLVAAEMLWREGIDFELRLLGHTGGARAVLTRLIDRLEKAGRPLTIERRANDDRVAESLAEARCVAFPSFHEGFGLPVVEALSVGVPVVTSNHGALLEIAEGGGTILVDPEDPSRIADGLRQLLTDDEFHARMVAEARARPVRTWNEYADDLWAELGW